MYNNERKTIEAQQPALQKANVKCSCELLGIVVGLVLPSNSKGGVKIKPITERWDEFRDDVGKAIDLKRISYPDVTGTIVVECCDADAALVKQKLLAIANRYYRNCT